ncbi:MAG: hypothetical protein ACHQ9S_22775 [Candidatus Binatia bacterium]
MTGSKVLWLGLPLLSSVVLLACADGRGSSGFDIRSEEAVIGQVLSTGDCGDYRTLVICAADTTAVSPSPTPTTPTINTPLPTQTPAAPIIITGLSGAVAFPCLPEAGACDADFTFRPQGFPQGTTFLVAVRGVTPNTFWFKAPAPLPNDAGGFATMVRITEAGGRPSRVEFAMLAFDGSADTVPTEFQELADTGAAYAFVTQALLIEPGQPPPTASTPAATPSPSALGPSITYLGLARADEIPEAPTGVDGDGRSVFSPSSGSGFSLVIEAAPGQSGSPVGINAVNLSGGVPDLQLLVSRPLGDGNPLVCDIAPPTIGGVPATNPLVYSTAPEVVAAMNDLGCRADDGTGNPIGRGPSDACTSQISGDFSFVNPESSIQFCLPIARKWAFPAGQTVLVVRARDASGNIGIEKEIVIDILTPSPGVRQLSSLERRESS